MASLKMTTTRRSLFPKAPRKSAFIIYSHLVYFKPPNLISSNEAKASKLSLEIFWGIAAYTVCSASLLVINKVAGALQFVTLLLFS